MTPTERMARFVVYRGEEILRTGACMESIAVMQSVIDEMEHVIVLPLQERVSAETHCVVNGILREKRDIGKVWGATKVSVGDEVAISGFPGKAHIMITGTANMAVDVEAGEPVRLVFEFPGTYRIEVDCGPRYFTQTTIMEVTI